MNKFVAWARSFFEPKRDLLVEKRVREERLNVGKADVYVAFKDGSSFHGVKQGTEFYTLTDHLNQFEEDVQNSKFIFLTTNDGIKGFQPCDVKCFTIYRYDDYQVFKYEY